MNVNDFDNIKYNQIIFIHKHTHKLLCKFIYFRKDKKLVVYESENKLFQCTPDKISLCTRYDVEQFYNNKIYYFKGIKLKSKKSIKSYSLLRKKYNKKYHISSNIQKENATELYREYILNKLIGIENYKSNSSNKNTEKLYSNICSEGENKKCLYVSISLFNMEINEAKNNIRKSNMEINRLKNELKLILKEGAFYED